MGRTQRDGGLPKLPSEIGRIHCRSRGWRWIAALIVCCLICIETPVEAKKKKKTKATADPYANVVFPPPPDEPRIKLERILKGRADVEAKSKWKKALVGASSNPLDVLVKPFAVEFDGSGRILVTDQGNRSLVRFDREEGRYDVFGVGGTFPLKLPLGLEVGPDETIYVADAGQSRVVSYDSNGGLVGSFGGQGVLDNPVDVAISPDGRSIYVADTARQQVVVLEAGSGALVLEIGQFGDQEGQFNGPTSLCFSPEGELYVVDQLNARVQVFDLAGEYLDSFGGRGVGFGNFVRPKDIAIDEVGFIYVTDFAFNNLQLFDVDFSLLTFIGSGGYGPGQFFGASGVAVRGDEIVVVDQLTKRVQIFRFLVPKG